MKYCENCGAQLSDDARFCTACGADQNTQKPEGHLHEEKPMPKKKKHWWKVILITVIIVAVLGGVGFGAMFYLNKSSKSDFRIGNMVNGNVVFEKDDWIYLTNWHGSTLKKIKKDREIELVPENKTYYAVYPTFAGNKIYYSYLYTFFLSGTNLAGFYSVDSDGQNNTQLTTLSTLEGYSYINEYEDQLYYINYKDHGIHRSDMNNQSEKVLTNGQWADYDASTGDINKTSGCDNLILQDGWLYFIYRTTQAGDEAGIYKVRPDGSEQQQLVKTRAIDGKAYMTRNAIILNDKLYFIVRGTDEESGKPFSKLYVSNIDGTEVTDTGISGVACYNVTDEWIYYGQNEQSENSYSGATALYRQRTDGTEKKRLYVSDSKDLVINNILFIKDKVYCQLVRVTEGDGKITERDYFTMNMDGSDPAKL